MQHGAKTLHYRRSHFATQLPVDYLYSPTHYWIARQGEDEQVWRIGLTRFATRMLGDMVDHGFEIEPDAAVSPGQIIGWVEGFKAIADVFCVAEGAFAGSNPALARDITLITREPYGAGWLYAVRGSADPRCVDVHAYRDHLDKTIERILSQQKQEKAE